MAAEVKDRALGALLGLEAAIGTPTAELCGRAVAALSRLASIAISHLDWPRLAQSAAARLAVELESDAQTVEVCELFVRILTRALLGYDKGQVLAPIEWLGDPIVAEIVRGGWKDAQLTKAMPTGALAALAVTLRAVAGSQDFDQAIAAASSIRPGCLEARVLTGQLAGAIWPKQ